MTDDDVAALLDHMPITYPQLRDLAALLAPALINEAKADGGTLTLTRIEQYLTGHETTRGLDEGAIELLVDEVRDVAYDAGIDTVRT